MEAQTIPDMTVLVWGNADVGATAGLWGPSSAKPRVKSDPFNRKANYISFYRVQCGKLRGIKRNMSLL